VTGVITGLEAVDVRFPTSAQLDGSDAMNVDPDYSAAYVVIQTDAGDGLQGHGFTFTIGRGNEVVIAAIRALTPLVVGLALDELMADLGGFWRRLTGDSQLRWLGPEKGVIHMATAAIVNAVWDLHAKREGKPLWKLLSDMTPEQIVGLVDFRYLTDAMTPAEAVALLEARAAGKAEREARLLADGYPAYTTSAGWLGYSDDKMRGLIREAADSGFAAIKVKVGRDIDEDLRRLAIARDELGPAALLMVDANQVWDVDVAIENVRRMASFDLWWVEEPTSPDDILGHARIARAVAPVRVASGEQCHNRIMFKQLLQAEAISFCQIDACRLGGVNELVAVLLLAAKFGVPVCPHAGGVGLCELVQHLSLFDFVAVSGSMEGRVIEYIDHLHEHFVDPAVVRGGRYMAPTAAGYSSEMRAESLVRYAFPTGEEWRSSLPPSPVTVPDDVTSIRIADSKEGTP
jgi:L-fuconate dehydratase